MEILYTILVPPVYLEFRIDSRERQYFDLLDESTQRDYFTALDKYVDAPQS